MKNDDRRIPDARYETNLPTMDKQSPRPQTPIMGWSSWNHFRIKISEAIIRENADAMVSSGMKDAGYRYINIDEGFLGGRGEDGNVFSDPILFPSGMKHLADTIHAKGLKAGIYSEAGTDTCGSQWDDDPRGFGIGLYGHAEKDLNLMLKKWGYDFIKIDWCGGLREKLDEQTEYTKISKLIRNINPAVVFNVCRWQYPGDWVKAIADSWRISADIRPTFKSITDIIDINADLWMHAGPGHVNDMDMLQIGRGMCYEEDKAHFSMWCMMTSPLLAGNDLREMSQETIEILTNEELIAINQDPLVVQARRLRVEGDLELWAKPLAGENHEKSVIAIALLNRSEEEKAFSFRLDEIGLKASEGYTLHDCWEHKTLGTQLKDASVEQTIPAHGVVVLRLTGTANSAEKP